MQDSKEESLNHKQAKSNNMTMKLLLDKWLSNLQPSIG